MEEFLSILESEKFKSLQERLKKIPNGAKVIIRLRRMTFEVVNIPDEIFDFDSLIGLIGAIISRDLHWLIGILGIHQSKKMESTLKSLFLNNLELLDDLVGKLEKGKTDELLLPESMISDLQIFAIENINKPQES